MTFRECKHLIKMDADRYKKSVIRLYFSNRLFRMIFRYRLLKFFQTTRLLKPLGWIERYIYHRTCVKCGCDIPSHVQIGGGWKIIHSWGIVMNSHTIAGENFTILSGSVVGVNHTGTPKFGNNVYLGAHSLVIGGVSIGNDVEIGAGAIVTHDVPDNAVVICDSAHIHKIKESLS